MSPSSGRLKTLRCSTKLAKKDKIDKIVNNVVLQILQITHLPGHLERPEYECRPPCSTPQKQKVTEHVSCEGYSRVSGQWVRARRAPRGGASVARTCTVRCCTCMSRGRTPSSAVHSPPRHLTGGNYRGLGPTTKCEYRLGGGRLDDDLPGV